MKIHGELLPGVKVVHHVKNADFRGEFYETWKSFNDGMRGTFRQLNTAISKQNVIRGMHRQDQTKLVMPVVGRIFDVALEPVTGKWCGVILDENCGLFIPPEYAHGYLALSDRTIIQYIVDAPYNKEAEENFKWNQYNIGWPTEIEPILSDKDR